MEFGAVFLRKIEIVEDQLKITLKSMLSSEFQVFLVCKNGDEFVFEDDEVHVKEQTVVIELERFAKREQCDDTKWDVYLRTKEKMLRVEDQRNHGRKRYQKGKKVKPYPEITGEYDQSERISDPFFLQHKEQCIIARYSRDYQLMLQVVSKREAYCNRFFLRMNQLSLENDVISLSIGKETFGFSIHEVKMTLRGTKKTYTLTSKDSYTYQLPLNQVEWEPFFWDFSCIVTRDGNEFELKFRNFKRNFTGDVRKKMGDFFLFSFYTQNDNIILHYRPYDQYDATLYRKREKKAVRIYRLLRPFLAMRGIVLMYEKFCKCAQDNAYYMFEYYMDKGGRDKRKTYYVIDPNEPDAEKLLSNQSHVIEFMSLKHMIYLQAAKLLVSTDTVKHAYHWRGLNTPILDALLKKHHVFLQHGVLALKRVDYIYNKNGGNKTDLFISSSPMEQKIIMDYFRYSKAEVPVTGLARWDVLENKNKENIILCMPTWRNWIIEVDEKDFVKTDYYRYYMAILNSQKFAKLLEENNTKLVFCMHPKFREFIGSFQTASERIQLFDYGQMPINEMVMQSSMMVTDYSSVSWDMYYQEKPIVFYQFDVERYEKEQGSYIDFETELYGDLAHNEQELFDYLEYYMKNGFKEKKKYADLRETYLPCRDGLHRKRIDEAIKKHAFTKMELISQKILHK